MVSQNKRNVTMKGYRVQVVAVSMYNYMEHYSNQITSDSVLGMYSFNEEVNCDKWVVGSHFHLGLSFLSWLNNLTWTDVKR